MDISIIIPLFNEEESLPELFATEALLVSKGKTQKFLTAKSALTVLGSIYFLLWDLFARYLINML